MTHSILSIGQRRRVLRDGTALILVLAALVLLSITVLSFLALTALSRQTAFASAGQARADWLAQTAMATIEGDLRAEIVAGSKPNGTPAGAVYDTGGIHIYVPTANATVVPQYVGPATSPSPNLMKISQSSTPAWSGVNYQPTPKAPTRSLANNKTDSSSLNQRSIAKSRWNQHYLLGTSVPGGWVNPDWVILTRSGAADANDPAQTWTQGSLVQQLQTLSDTKPNNSYRAIGRYAYAIYNEGGLIDINVAGNSLPAAQASLNQQRGRLNQISLAELKDSNGNSLIGTPSTLLDWRNQYSKTDANYTSPMPISGSLFDPLLSFLDTRVNSATGASDQRFVNRSDLISYAKANPTVVSTDALQYLATFTRDQNAPTWTPNLDAAAAAAPFNQTQFNYKSNAESTATNNPTINRDLANIRYAKNGTISATPNIPSRTVTAGEPMLKQRFPLNRLTWVGHNGPANGATAADLKRAFGLVYKSPGVYEYDSADPNATSVATSIKTLTEIAQNDNVTRDPDFFELLQAGILNGSLSLPQAEDDYTKSPAQCFRTNADTRDLDRSPTRQLVQIGVNLIDQVQPDNWPTTVLFDWFGKNGNRINLPAPTLHPALPIGPPFTPSSNLAYLSDDSNGLYLGIVGQTDMPYVYKIWQTYYRHPNLGGVAGTNNDGHLVGVFQFVEMWNPYQPPANSIPGPTSFRVRVEQGISLYSTNIGLPITPFDFSLPTNLQGGGAQEIITTAGAQETFRKPTILSSSNSTGNIFWGRQGQDQYLTKVGADTVWLIPGGYGSSFDSNPHFAQAYYFSQYAGSTARPPIYRVDFLNSNGNWSTFPYQILPEVCFYAWDGGDPSGKSNSNYWDNGDYLKVMARPDPRGEMLGLSESSTALNQLIGITGGDTYNGKPTNHTYQELPYYSNDPGEPGGIFTGNYQGNLYSNIIWHFFDTNNYGSAPGVTVNDFSINLKGNHLHYTDLDGIARVGDLYNSSLLGSLALPNPSPNPDIRPIILHRPFRSVGEMGYAFRGTPWKSLDLFSANSADAGLLDLFTVNDTVTNQGPVDINTRQLPVLQALLAGSIKAEANGNNATSTYLSATDAQALAQNLAALSGGGGDGKGPLSNISELATRFMPNWTATLPANSFVKTQQEAAVRTLSQIGQTRVWNLLIDLIVQSGRYSAQAKTANDFVVEGERHYWLHIALDRSSGKIIDQSLEPILD